VNDDALTVDLVDRRTVAVPLAWFQRLAHGTPDERAHWRLIGGGEGMHWPDQTKMSVWKACWSASGLAKLRSLFVAASMDVYCQDRGEIEDR
jgi:hypothetical protein